MLWQYSNWDPLTGTKIAIFDQYRPVHTDGKVEFNTVDFVETSTLSLWPRTHWQQSRLYRQQSPL